MTNSSADPHGGVPVHIEALGLALRIRHRTKAAAEATARDWASMLTPEVPGSVVVNAPGDNGDMSRVALTREVTGRAIEGQAGRMLMFHAAALTSRIEGDDSGAVVLVGPSGMGKSTAAVELGRRGWGYLTDETAAIDRANQVLPYPKPLLIGTRGGPHVAKRPFPPGELDLVAVRQPRRVAALFLLDRNADVSRPEVFRPSTTVSMSLLAEHTSFLAALPRPLQRMANLLGHVEGLRVVSYRDADQLEDVLNKTLEGVR